MEVPEGRQHRGAGQRKMRAGDGHAEQGFKAGSSWGIGFVPDAFGRFFCVEICKELRCISMLEEATKLKFESKSLKLSSTKPHF